MVNVVWHPFEEKPPVPEGGIQEFVVSRERTNGCGPWSFAAYYLNRHRLPTDDCPDDCDGSCADQDGCQFSGWYVGVNRDGDSGYEALYGLETMKGWCELPQWEEVGPW